MIVLPRSHHYTSGLEAFPDRLIDANHRPSRRCVMAAIGALIILLANAALAQAPAAADSAPEPAAADAKPAEAGPKPAPKQPKSPLIEIDARFFEIPAEDAGKLGLIPAPTTPNLKGQTRTGKPGPAAPVPTVDAVLEPFAAAKLLQRIGESKNVKALSSPSVATRSGQRAVIEVIREFRYPTEFEFDKGAGIITPKAFETRNLGITLEVEPVAEAEGPIDLNLVPQVVRLDGYVRASDGQPVPLRNGRSVGADMTLQDFAAIKYPRDTVLQPIFSTSKISTSISLWSGQTLVLGGLRKDEHEDGKPAVSRMLYVIITARRVEAPAGAAAEVLPVAVINKADEEGFVRSPFAPEAKPIDARGLPAGTELKCPVTKRLFRLP